MLAMIFGPRLMGKFFGDKGKLRHPGTIVVVENPSGTTYEEAADEKPLNHQWVFLKDGREVASPEEADTIIPIVRVDLFKGPDNSILEIHEQGPNGQSLRRTYGRK